ncbi:MAG: hypothetical protein COB04_05855 [Gammaproteobacteria bacterium]|nr:MAG: hypothetical protein COB04_05855 [Gammaproteobacteria bacterium]
MVDLNKNNLCEKIKQVSQYAEMTGVQLSAKGKEEILWQNSLPFILRLSDYSEAKQQLLSARKRTERSLGRPINPFLPFDERTYVDDLSSTHVCLINKFNATANHVMVVRKEYEPQMTVLNREDFYGAWVTAQATNGLCYYNAGPDAGASVDHKHLHVIPKEEITIAGKLPVEYSMPSAEAGDFFKLPHWDFKHLAVRLDCEPGEGVNKTIDYVYSQYIELMGHLELLDFGNETGIKGAYNLLLTPDWLLIVPRSRARSGSIALNSLAFAGAMLVENEVQQLVVRHKGMLNMLKSVAYL